MDGKASPLGKVHETLTLLTTNSRFTVTNLKCVQPVKSNVFFGDSSTGQAQLYLDLLAHVQGILQKAMFEMLRAKCKDEVLAMLDHRIKDKTEDKTG